MPNLEKVKLIGIKLEDKPKAAEKLPEVAAQKKGGLLRKSLGGLFKEKQTTQSPVKNLNETVNETSQTPRSSMFSKMKGKFSLNRSSVLNNESTVA